VLLDPLDTVRLLATVVQTNPSKFLTAVGTTVFSVILSFIVAFFLALLIAALAYRFPQVRDLLHPLLVVMRTAPTMAVIVILLLTVPWGAILYAVAFLVTFPLLFENLLGAFKLVNKGELDAGRALGLRFFQRFVNIVLPNISPALWSNIIASVSLNYKVVIAAELLGLPSLSIGYSILQAKSALDYHMSFLWLVVSIIIAWLLGGVLQLLRKVFD
jgi:NitT/TauT family transport system permease protein